MKYEKIFFSSAILRISEGLFYKDIKNPFLHGNTPSWREGSADNQIKVFLSKFVIKCIIPTASVQNTIDFQYFRLKFDY